MAVPPVAEAPARPALSLRTQLARFVVVGGFSALVDFGCYSGLLAAGVWVHLAKALAFVAGTTTAYLVNRRWTFRGSGGGAEFASVLGLYALTFAVQVGVNALVLALLPRSPWEIVGAFVVAQGTATCINFVVQRTIIFRTR